MNGWESFVRMESCTTLNPAGPTRHDDGINFGVEIPPEALVRVYLHNPGQMIFPHNKKSFGSAVHDVLNFLNNEAVLKGLIVLPAIIYNFSTVSNLQIYYWQPEGLLTQC